ncbi:type III-A CRISPR-associated RAMP protein Csm5 [Kovacikia minuta CCNUW1]|uniref:type III-A CRISPR-associated RAMP protein Csm5 n=1 Tax=Kovacikia minuta TaxID=2931930 RepID=UPI001CCA5220|nr:type III-A CRISPR-associated RAMP protein Csm5 [Kovacikia minuta]UBF28007.1 type III-A CRISPR-associated RAMP protein Csm5 [Kovacikia minuta CCNUW1]
MVASPEHSLIKPDFYEVKQIQLTSPILHIGSEVQKLNPFEYVQAGKFVYRPNQDALARALRERGHLNDYIQRIQDRQEIEPLLTMAFGDRWRSETDANGEPLFPESSISRKWTKQKITDLRPMIRNGMGQLYIPGSSIKGAIRTAVAYHLIKYSDRYHVPRQQQISEIERKLRESMGTLRQQAKFADDKLFMDRLFTDFDLMYGDRQFGNRKGPNTDFMRAVHVTDTAPLLEQEVVNKQGQKGSLNLPVVAEVLVSSHFEGWKAKYRASIYAEMVRLVQTQFSISLDQTMLSWFHHSQGMDIPFQTIDDILKICQEFAQDQWDYEHDYWQEIQNNPNAKNSNGETINLDFGAIQDFYEPEKCPYNIRLGWASGMTGTTISLLIRDEELRSEIRDTCGIKAPGFEAPKSRRTVIAPSGEIKFVPGWVKFRTM